MLNNLKILYHQGKQYIPDVTTVKVPGIFRGRPVISSATVDEQELMAICPTGAISNQPVRIDMGKCTFCGECAFAFPQKIHFTTDYKIAANRRNDLVIAEGIDTPVKLDADSIRKEIHAYFGGFT